MCHRGATWQLKFFYYSKHCCDLAESSTFHGRWKSCCSAKIGLPTTQSFSSLLIRLKAKPEPTLIDLKYLNHAKSMLTFSVKIFFCPYDLFQQQIERRRQNEQRNPWEAAFHDYVLAQRRQAPARTAVSYSGNADEAGVHMGNTAFNNLLFYYSFNSFLFGLLGCFVMLVVYFMFCYFFQPPPI